VNRIITPQLNWMQRINTLKCFGMITRPQIC